MKTITLDIDKVLGAVTRKQIDALAPKVTQSMEMLHKGIGPGNDFLGWLNLPFVRYDGPHAFGHTDDRMGSCSRYAL